MPTLLVEICKRIRELSQNNSDRQTDQRHYLCLDKVTRSSAVTEITLNDTSLCTIHSENVHIRNFPRSVYGRLYTSIS